MPRCGVGRATVTERVARMLKLTALGTLGLVGLIVSQLLTDVHEFYPTQPGDTWTYESSIRGQFTNQVADSVLTEGLVIFRILSTDSSGRERLLMVRQDGPRLYLGSDPESLDLLADFSLEVGASTPTRMGMQEATLTVAGRHENLDVFGTQFEDVVEVHIELETGSGLTYYYVRGVGLVGMESDRPTSQVRLIKAIVGGRTVGAATP